jgi:hypothetical protein
VAGLLDFIHPLAQGDKVIFNFHKINCIAQSL